MYDFKLCLNEWIEYEFFRSAMITMKPTNDPPELMNIGENRNWSNLLIASIHPKHKQTNLFSNKQLNLEKTK